MSSRKQVTVRDLVEEAKKRIVFLVICVVGLSYLMSLTSSSVMVNLPAAASLIILLRYLSLDFEMRRKAAAYDSKPSSSNIVSQNKTPEGREVVHRSNWRRKVKSPAVEDAIDKFTRHLVSEWVTDLWYSRLTPDKEGPEELVQIINGVFGEISGRVRNINLINLLTRDLINLICRNLELFRASQAKFEKQQSVPLTLENRDIEIRRILAAENKLHPALFSAEAEHKVLQCVMDGLISFTFRHEDLQCTFFHYTVRELLACAVIRPVLNLASPRFINERIEILALSRTKVKGATEVEERSQSRPSGSSKISSDDFSTFLDPSVTGVELVQLKNNQPKASTGTSDVMNGAHLSKDPLLSIDTRSIRSWGCLPMDSHTSNKGGIQRHYSGGEWGEMLDQISHRKTQALAPENFENMWAKGRNYKEKEGENRVIEKDSQHSAGMAAVTDHSKVSMKSKENDYMTKVKTSKIHTVRSGFTEQQTANDSSQHTNQKISNRPSVASYEEDDEHNPLNSEEVESGSSTSYSSEDKVSGDITGLGSPGTKVWDGKSNRNMAVSHIHHPLENPGGHITKKTGRRHVRYQKSRTHSGRKISKFGCNKLPVWQEVERSSFLSGDGQDILSSPKGLPNIDESSDDSDIESLGRSQSGAAASSSASLISLPESRNLSAKSLKSSLMVDSFFKLRCEVLGANIVKSGSKNFAVYSISVIDSNNNSWSIKRRFRHFEELHRRLKIFPEYNLHLPPKHFLSTGLDVSVIQERCNLLDRYLKKLLQLPTVSGSIEVWDFLSVDSQTYLFSNSFSIIETLSVDLEDKPTERNQKVSNTVGHAVGPYSSKRESSGTNGKESAWQVKDTFVAEGLKAKEMSYSKPQSVKDSNGARNTVVQTSSSTPRNSRKTSKERESYGVEETSSLLQDPANDPTLPNEWVPPNLSIPILDLVDVIFQLQDGGWIRRKAFWVAKQVLQLGMGDAFDDWLMEKIQLLRRGSVVASGIKRVEQILWPDGIFITKHPKRRPPPPPSSPTQSSPQAQQPAEISSPRSSDDQNEEAERRAKFVYELMIDKAPAAIVGLVGRKEYEQCAKDLYFFIQSSVCLKQLAFDLLELLLLSAFPEMDYIFKQFHEEKHKFGEFKPA